MQFLNRIAMFLRRLGAARVLLPMGAVLVVFGIIMLGFRSDDFIETTGTITEVRECFTEPGETQQYDVEFTYFADGESYQSVFSNLSGNFVAGEEIKVFYDPEDPTRTTNTKAGGFIAPLMIAVGAVMIVGGVFVAVKALAIRP